MKKLLVTTIGLLLLISQAMAAAPLLDYEKRVARATEQINRINTDENYLEEGVSYVKKLLPQTETVELKERTVDVDNKWLHEKLDLAVSDKNKENRKALFAEIQGSLEALDQHLIDAEDISRGGENNAQVRESLKRILAEEKYREKKDNPIAAFIKEKRKQVFDLVSRLWNRIMNALFGASRAGGGLFKFIFFAIALIVGYFIIRMIWKYKPTKKRSKKRTVLGEEIEEDTKPADLADAALAAAKTGDFRLGMRKLYIAFLYELSERNLIELNSHATNWEYLSLVSRFTSLVPAMRYLTERFDYFWYGMFPSSHEDFVSYLESYRAAVKQVQTISEQTPHPA
jgi:hypothetical protein